ncbi:MAG: malto-oligosyltrehalose synthase [Simkaniaceae bacterium]|nr:malto-oligosyltrehalose synthase [Simkaniaceae bacterium]
MKRSLLTFLKDMIKKSSFSPVNAYRLQLGPHFKIKDAIRVISYLKSLGIDTVYTSPYFEIPKGSNNPYLITSPNRLNTLIGTPHQFSLFFKELKYYGLAHLLDFVPNHLAATVQNPWFFDVLEKGPSSPYAHFFDINYDPHYKPLKNKILLPILPIPLEEAIHKGYIKLIGSGSSVSVRIGPIALPISEESQIWISDHLTKSIHEPKQIEKILSMQHYLLAYWKSGYDLINYRRFFDINDLIGINMQYDDVFKAFHEKAFHLIQEGHVQGIRIDHPDGLYEPAKYLKKLQDAFPGLYVIVEKILEKDENLPNDWPVDGSVGYEYLNLLNGLFVDQTNEKLMTKIYEDFTGVVHKSKEMLILIKRQIIGGYLKGEIKNITKLILEKANDPALSFSILKDLIVELLCHIPVYRTYANENAISSDDEEILSQAIHDLEASLKGPLPCEMLILKQITEMRVRFPLLKLQQLMPCVMAKSLEDTFLYRYHRLISLNEVGSNPLQFGTSAESFHIKNRQRLERFPLNFIPTSTHDTKRSEDVRYRISVLSELPSSFQEHIKLWHQLNLPHNPGIDKNIEFFIYQTLIGFWPGTHLRNKKSHKMRLHDYLSKAMREAKDYTNWVDPNLKYEENARLFLEHITNRRLSPDFLSSLDAFVDEIIALGRFNSLSSIILKMGSPGVFDLYQGMECFEDSLVDPDNRREVDFSKRRSLLLRLNRKKTTERLLSTPPGDFHKMALTHFSLKLRQAHADLFLHGDYIPLTLDSPFHQHVIAFMRQKDDRVIICIAFRFFSSIKKLPHTSFHLKLPFELKKIEDPLYRHPVIIETFDHGSYLKIDYEKTQGLPLVFIGSILS